MEYGLAGSLQLLAMTGCGTLFSLIDLLAGGHRFGFYVPAWVLTGLAARAALVGVYVSSTAIRIRLFWKTHTVPWTEVLNIDTTARGWSGHETIRVMRRGWGVIIAPIRRGPPGAWRPALYAGQRGGATTRVLPPREFEKLVAVLTTSWRDAVPAAP
ncbi:hypothetical protein Cci01nite_10340 [Catellatospora citrea]|uniref:Uncharacterized protein n=2 Tax=Catellatospora citrea TaxID=53366 RepID=A0A8J3KEY3_9ACTN|nr:hypothetical protein C8E86_7764 [Catellatospora citrea]GIF95940.1 hypothetical protein Cci01nite_10340 [Catellatospora citrea]